MNDYTPKQGDIIKMNFNPTKGHEQQGNRPAIIVNNDIYYKKTKLIIVCPISNTENNFPLHIKLDKRTQTTGSILTQHIRTIDPEARNIEFIEKSPISIISKILDTTKLFF